MKIFLQNFKIQAALLFLIMVCLGGSVYGQVLNDYRTTKSGDWTDITVWEKYNGTAWITVTSTEGYPCQMASVTRFVYILNSHNVTCPIGASGFYRPARIDIAAGANNTSLTFTSSSYFEVNGAIVMTAPSTGNAFLNVNAASVNTNGNITLGDTTSGATDCEIAITSGSLTLFSGNVAMSGAADENAVRLGSGTLRCNAGINGGNIVAGNGTVEYGFSGAQTINAYAFNNLVLSGSGIKTFAAGATITKSLTISGTAIAGLPNGANYIIPSLSYAGLGQTGAPTSYGSNNVSTVANIKTDTYFNTATTGIITVPSNLPFVRPTIINYTYTGLAQGPNSATNSGTGSTYNYSYTNNGGTPYGPTSALPTSAGNYFVTVTVDANGAWASNNSGSINFTIVPRNLTLTAIAGVKSFGNTFPTGIGSINFTSVGLQSGQTVGTVTIDSAGALNSAAVGSYPTVPSAATGGTFTPSNYNLIYVNGILTVSNPTTGDYRTIASGNWTTLNTWERWNGTVWATPLSTSPEGYPGQYNTTATTPVFDQRAYISNGHSITVDTNIAYTLSFTRIEFLASSLTGNTSLTFAPGVSLSMNGAVVIEDTNGNNTISVGSGSFTCAQMRLTNSTGAAEISEINVTTGSVTITSTTAGIQLNGTTAKSIFRFTGSGALSINQGITGGGAFIAGTSIVTFGNFGTQTIPGYAFNNVVLSGSGIKTVTNTTTIAGELSIATGCSASLATGINYTIDSLILGTTGSLAGTWGGTGSGATNINTTYFAATTGYLTVGKSTPDVTPTVGTYTYNGLSQGPNTATNNGTGTSYTYSYRNDGGTAYGPSATAPTNAGDYFVTATVAANGSFTARTSTDTKFVILKRGLTITANSDTKLVGLTYTVGANSTAFSSFGLQNGETIGTITTASIGAPSGAAVGSYPIVPSVATGGTFSSANYTISFGNGTLTVANPSTGDYRSKASGVWTAVTTWERYNGTSWVEPLATTPEGYPSQFAAPSVVYISDGNAVNSGTIFVPNANLAGRIELVAGSANSSLTIDGTSTLGASGGIRIRPSTLAGVTRTIDVGNGRLTAGNILIEDTGNDGVDSEIIIGAGTLYLGNGNCAMGGSSLRNAIRFTGAGTLQLDANNGQILGGTIVAGTGRVSFSDNDVQVVGAYAFNNLTLTDAGIKSINAAATIAGNLTISGSAKAQLPTGANIPVNSLILGSNGKLLGTWGSTTSSPTPTYNDNIYFETNATAGILTVAKSTSDVIVIIGSYVYTGAAQGPNTATNLPGTGSSYTFSYVNNGGTAYGPSATAPTNVGNYFVTATVAANGDFVTNSSAATAFAITVRNLIITANDGVKVYGDTFVVGAGSTAFTSTGLQAGQTIGTITTASLGAVSSAIVGTYPIVATLAIGGTFSASNYNITYIDGTLTVNPRLGDYRSVTSGNWNLLATWERWNGSAWVTPIASEGYPGQIVDLRVVHIQPGHNINGNITTVDPRRIRDLIFLEGGSASSLSIIGGNSIKINNQVIVRSGANRDINIGVGFLSVGSFNFSDTGSDSIDSKITIGTGAVFVSGTLAMQGSSDRNVVEFTGSGSLQFINNGSMTGGGLIPSTGTVHYNGPANQTVGTYAYTNLILSNGGIKTVSATTTISSNLTIRDAASASLNTGTTYNIGTLTLGCLGRENGSWGSSGPHPDPTYVDNTYFQNTTGFINVATNTRPQHSTAVVETCEVPGKITITPPPVIGATSYTIDGTIPDSALITNTTGVFSGLAPGIYEVFSTSACGNSQPTYITINPLVTKTWNGSAWSPAGNPTSDQNILFTANYAQNADVTACACTINSGTVNFPEGRYLKLGGKLTVNTPGTLTFENNASLVQTANYTGTNTGDINYNRNFTGGELDYTYWSSPVVGQNLFDLSPLTKLDKFYSFNSGANDWDELNPISTSMIVGKGYIIRGIPTPSIPPIGLVNLIFKGVPNNGSQSISVSAGKTSNLIGNPYPSAIDADAFILANTAAIDGTLYFWTHNTPIAIGTPDPGTGFYAYSGNDYATYTLSGGVATKVGNSTPEWKDDNRNRVVDLPGEFNDKNGNGTLDKVEWIDGNIINTLETNEWTDTNNNNIAETGEWTDTNSNNIFDSGEWTDTNSNTIKDFDEWTDTNSNNFFNTGEWNDANGDKRLNLQVEQVANKPTGKIAAGQSFFTTSTTAGGAVNFTNDMRIDGSGIPMNNSNFYKTKNPKSKTTSTSEKHRIWLNLTNLKGAFKQTLVGYIPGATNVWDKLYDGESFDGNNFLDFYSINEDKNLTIQGRALPFDENDEIPLGYRIDLEGSFTIKIDETDGLLKNQAVFLEDKLTKNLVNLKEGDYTFNTGAGTFNNRFVLRYTNKTLGIEKIDANDDISVLYSNNLKTLFIRNYLKEATVNSVTLYNILGQKLANWDVKDKEQTNIQILINNLPAEIYIVKVKTNLGESSKKIIIK